MLDGGSRAEKDHLCDNLNGQTTWGNLNIRQLNYGDTAE